MTAVGAGEPAGGAQRTRRRRAGEPAGSPGGRLNATVIELAPGQNAGPYCFEYADEELLLVTAGSLTVRIPRRARARAGRPGLLLPGPDGAHEIRNDGDAPARLLVLATRHEPRITAYPDHGTLTVTPPGLRYRVADAI